MGYRSRHHSWFVALVGVLVVLAAASCGGADGEDDSVLDNDPVLPRAEAGDERVEDDRVVGGIVAPAGAFPSVAMLVDGSARQFCGGALVAPGWVLTAGHCVHETGTLNRTEPGDIEVVLGRLLVDGDGGERIGVRAIKPHPLYTVYLNYDLALLELERESSQPPIEIFDARSDAALSVPGSPAYLAGWGGTATAQGSAASRSLLYTTLPIASDAECAAAIRVRAPTYSQYLVPTTMLCAGGEVARDACPGDSGGPLMVREERNIPWVLIGVVSWGPETTQESCGLEGVPGVYADPAAMRDFIVSVLEADGIQPPPPPSALAPGEVTTSKITVEWRENASNETHLIIAAAVEGTDRWSYYRVPANASSQRFTAPSHVVYLIGVQACNNAGCSPYSNFIEVRPTD